MKSINKMAVVAVLALSGAGIASAQTVRVTGSTAFRVADVSAEVALCGGTSATAHYWGSNLTGSNFSVVEGNGFIFENFFNGSVAGDQALEVPVKLAFPKASGLTFSACTAPSAPTTVAGGGTADSASAPTVSQQETPIAPDIAFSDVSFPTAQQIIKKSSQSTNNTPTDDNVIGIVPFVFVADGTSDVDAELGTAGILTGDLPKAPLSMDPQKFTFTWSSGASANLAFFTGNLTGNDPSVVVYPMGRDVDSGTRATSLAESGYGLNGSGIITTPVLQYYPFDTSAHATADYTTANADSTGVAGFNATTGVCGVDSAATTIGFVGLVPFESVDGYLMSEGDGGFYSGGNLAKGMTKNFASGMTNTVLMAYLGASDAVAALTGTHPATLMAYNGVTWLPGFNGQTSTQITDNSNLIYSGKYTFWSYEHEFDNGGSAATVATALMGQISGNLDALSSNQVTLGGMQVGRNADGGNVQ